MAVTHVVQCKFKDGTAKEKVEEATNALLALKQNCLLPASKSADNEKKTYIQNVIAGTDMSIENLNNGYTHIFVVTFASKEDRDYYVKEDAAHIAYVNDYAKVLWDQAQVLDFEDGKFA